MYFIYPVVDVSAQSCIITPINPSTLTATGGELASGTENVTINCNCTDDGGMVVVNVSWYDPDGNRLVLSGFVPGTPHIIRAGDNTNVELVIPTFTDSYDGIYTCGMRVDDVSVLGPPNATIDLTNGND